jgi:hypothetical protein
MSKARSTNPKHRKHNVGDQKQVLHMGFQAKHESQLEKMKLSFKYLLGLLYFQMLGCGCFKNLVPNLLMFDRFQIWFPTNSFFTHYSISLIIWRFIVQLGSKTIQTCNQWGKNLHWFNLPTKHENFPLMATMFDGGQWLRYSMDGDERGPHVWQGRPGGGALWLETRVEHSSMGGI